MCLKLTIKTPERRQRRRFGVFIVNFEHISHLLFSSVSIFDFEQVNIRWKLYIKTLWENQNNCFLCLILRPYLWNEMYKNI